MTEELLLKDLEKVTSESFLHDVARGIRGGNTGLDNGLGRADEFLCGLQRGTYYLFGADSGVGKTTLADEIQLLRPWEDAKAKGKKLKTLYVSWELSKPRKKIRFATRFLNRDFGVRLPVNYILSKGKFRCSQQHWELCKMIEPKVEELFSDIRMIDEPCTSRRIFQACKKFAEQHGKFKTQTVINEHGDTEEEVIGYTPNDPDTQVQFMLDHLSLADEDPGHNLKWTMDRISQIGVYFRNRCGWTITIIQQFSGDMQTTDRRKFDKSHVIPLRNDFGDTKYTFRDADVTWGLIAPRQFGFDEYQGYPAAAMGPSYVHGFLMKNRDGPPGISYPLFLDAMAHNVLVPPNPKFDLNGDIQRFYELGDLIKSELDKKDFSDQVPLKQLSV